MLERIKVSSFKSLVNFDLKLGKFNCIIGLNGAGKSSVLQLISYISSLFQGNTQQWLDTRGWDAKDVVSHFLHTRKTIEFSLTYSFEDKSYLWTGVFNWQEGTCTKESFIELRQQEENRIIYRVVNGQYRTHKGRIDINFNYSGSILSALNDEVLPYEAVRFRNYISQIDSHDLLSPKVMRSGQYSAQGRLGSAGEYLIHHIHELDETDKEILQVNLAKYFPQVIKLETRPLTNGTLALYITERFYKVSGVHSDDAIDEAIDVVTDARHINDGMLRLLNILANQRGSTRFQLFDEVENGVNPEVTEILMESFVNSPQQTLITTHSPMVLNYLDDQVAIDSIILVYKQKNGMTNAKHLFEIPSAKEKLDELAPGEVMVDLYLDKVAEEAADLARVGE